MRFNYGWCCAAVMVCTIRQPVGAQQAAYRESAPSQTTDALEALSTLEIVRSNNSGIVQKTDVVGEVSAGMREGAGTVTVSKRVLLQQINELRLLLNAPNEDRKELEPLLREALSEYFVVDMEERVREFDKVKARVAQMESKLQTRLDRRNEIVELQIKQMLHKADGLDFFVPDSAVSGPDVPGRISVGMPGMMGAGGSTIGESGGAGDITIAGTRRPGVPGVTITSDKAYSGATMRADVQKARVFTGPGYDVGYGITHYLRLPNMSLSLIDPLNLYAALDANSDRKNDLAKLKAEASDEEKLKAILLAMHTFADIFKHFPAPANVRSKNEKPHSWRVALLPVLGHAELYKQYRFDEPWDSENNLKFVEKMPAVFSTTDDPGAKSGKTRFQMLVGNGAAFDLSRPTEFRDITDGLSNTIALAVASSSVPWTQPEDTQFVPNASLAKLAPSRLVGMCDGAVRKLLSANEATFTVLATRAGGEPSPY